MAYFRGDMTDILELINTTEKRDCGVLKEICKQTSANISLAVEKGSLPEACNLTSDEVNVSLANLKEAGFVIQRCQVAYSITIKGIEYLKRSIKLDCAK